MNGHTYWSNGILREVTDGVLRREIPKANGVAREWHANSTLAKEWNVINGKADGLVREWHDNGKLAREWSYNRGQIDGVVRQWSREGTLLGECELKMGWGIERKWNDDGSPRSELEKLAENAYRGKIWDDLGKARETFLWNGKPTSKKRFYDKLARKEAETSM